MLNREEARSLIEKVTSYTGYYAKASLNVSEQGTTRFANSEISQNIAINDANIELTLYDGKKETSCSTNVLTDEGLKQLVQDAEAMLKHVPEGEYGAFPFSGESVTETAPDGKLSSAFGTSERAALVKAGIAEVEPGYNGAGALILTSTATAIGDNKGGFRYSAYDNVTFNTVVTHQDGTAGAGECGSYTTAPDIVAQFKKAQATAKAARNPISPELGAHTVVLSPNAFGDLVSFMAMMLNAKSVDDGASFAIGNLGKKVFGENLTITDDITNPLLRPLHFDSEGNPRRKLSLIDKGVVANYLYDNKRAAKHNTKPTGHALVTRFASGAFPLNVVVQGGEQSLEEIIASTPKGIFINEFHYTNFVNARKLQITGLTRNGAFLIENGKLTTPMATVRFTESLLDAFNAITAISKEQELISGFGASLIPAVRIENFHFTSKP